MSGPCDCKFKFDCIQKIQDFLADVGSCDMSDEELVKATGHSAEVIATWSDEQKEAFCESLKKPPFSDTNEKIEKWIQENIVSRAKEFYKDSVEYVEELIEQYEKELREEVQKVVDFFNKKPDIKLELGKYLDDTLEAGKIILCETVDQINNTLCHGNIFENLSNVGERIDNTVSNILEGLSETDTGKLLTDPGFLDGIIDFATDVVKVLAIIEELKSFKKNNDYEYAPTSLTVGSNIPTSVSYPLSALSGRLVDKSPKLMTTSDYINGGPWDYEGEEHTTIYNFNVNDSFTIKADDLLSITDLEMDSFLREKYSELYKRIDFTKDVNEIENVSDELIKSSEGDLVFNVGLVGDTTVATVDSLQESVCTAVFTVNHRKKAVSNCKERDTTEMTLVNAFSFRGLGNSIADSRYNAYLECSNQAVNTIMENRGTINAI